MKWYKKYLTVFEKPFDSVSKDTVNEIKTKLSLLQSEAPVASVVVIAYNEERRLLSCLWSLSESKCKYPIEIIGVDNNSSDKTREIFKTLGIRHFVETQKSCGYARNRGLQEAKGKYYICIDSDTMYPTRYVESMIEELNKEGVVAVSATWSYVPSKKYPRYIMYFYELLRDINLWLLSFKSPERSVRGLVFAYKTELGRKVGYRVQIIRGEDGSMAYGLRDYGKISFIRKSRVKAVTATNTLESDGPLFRAFAKRVFSSITGIRRYFKKASGEVVDHPSNLIDNK